MTNKKKETWEKEYNKMWDIIMDWYEVGDLDVRIKTFIRTLLKDQRLSLIEEIIEKVLPKEEKIHDLPPDNGGKCGLLDHKIGWDGNYYTCAKCGIEFVPAKWINDVILETIKRLREFKNL